MTASTSNGSGVDVKVGSCETGSTGGSTRDTSAPAATVTASAGNDTNSTATVGCIDGIGSAGNQNASVKAGRCRGGASKAVEAGGTVANTDAGVIVSCLGGSFSASDLASGIRAGGCPADDGSNAVDVTAGNGDTTAAGSVSCVDGSVGDVVNGAAYAGSCATPANAVDATARSGDTAAAASVSCLNGSVAGEANGSASAGSCAPAGTTNAVDATAGNGDNTATAR